jgi:hypothetical protein
MVAGIVLVAVFSWLLIRNIKRYGARKALFSPDILIGIAAGMYLVITSII